ncbi:hypothetical protein ACFLSA_00825 [Bacteroidota bacterium]
MKTLKRILLAILLIAFIGSLYYSLQLRKEVKMLHEKNIKLGQEIKVLQKKKKIDSILYTIQLDSCGAVIELQKRKLEILKN